MRETVRVSDNERVRQRDNGRMRETVSERE